MTSLSFQVLTVVSSFILPKLFLQYYGSEVNGLVASITQFLGFIALMELGIGAVVQSSLYKPLVENNIEKISAIIHSAQKFFNRIAVMFLFYIILLAVFFPKIDNSFSPLYSSTLIFIIAISSIAQYFFGITNQLLLSADQKTYVATSISILTLVLNTIISVALITSGFGIHMVKLLSSLILVLRPVFLNIYVRKHYKLIKNIDYSYEPIEQKWNGITQHMASFVLKNTDIVILTIFSDLISVSIYSVYKLIVTGIQQLILALTTGIQSLFGQMLANNELEALKKRFLQFEWLIHLLVTILFSCTAVLIVPFVQIYTKGITDAKYTQPLFALLITMAIAMYCLRLPYNIMVLAAGHYKQTQTSAIIEMLMNIIISISLVIQFGVVGVSIGTLCAMTYRTVYLASYMKNIIDYNFFYFIKHIIIDCIIAAVVYFLSTFLTINNTSYFKWMISAILIVCIGILVTIVINYIFNRNMMKLNLKNRS